MLGGLLALPGLLAGPLDGGGGPFNGGAVGPTGATGATGPVLDCASTVGLHSCEVHLNAGQVNALFSSPAELVAAPGANNIIVAQRVVGQLVAGTHAFPGTIGARAYLTSFANPLKVFTLTTPSNSFPSSLFSSTTNVVIELEFSGLSSTEAGEDPVTVKNQPLRLATVSDMGSEGSIATSAVAGPGTGYAVNDTGLVDGGGDANATYLVTTVGAGGSVTGYTLPFKGTGYSTAFNPISTSPGGGQPGIGSGFTINVNSVDIGNGDVYIRTDYRVVALH